MENRLRTEMKGIISRGLGLLRIDHITNLDDSIRLEARKKVDVLEQDLYDLIDGKEETDVVEAPTIPTIIDEPVAKKKVSKKVTKKVTKKAVE